MLSELSSTEVLKQALADGIIDINTLSKQIEMNERKKYLNMHKYEIWQGEKDGKWYTYLPDDKKGRRLKKRTTRKSIEDCVVEYWKSLSKEEIEREKAKRITLKSIFPEWLNYKEKHTNSTSYIKRITADWQRFYQINQNFINMPMHEMTTLFLDEWAHDMIKKHELTKKSYYNMSMILRQCLDYSVEKNYINENPFDSVKINTKMFRRVKKKMGDTEVYTMQEEERIVMDMFRRFNGNTKNTAPLAVVLAFEIGVRIGELCALKFEDIEGNYIQIQRQEVREFEKVSDYKMRFKGFKIVDYTKSDDGFRQIYLTETAREIIKTVKKFNIKNGESNNGYIFVKEGKNINHYSIQAMILRGCKSLGMKVKTSHKIRKTYISTLIDSGLNIDQIRRMAGHSDERTTYGNYCYNRLTDIQTETKIEEALNVKKVIKGNQIFNVFENEKTAINKGITMVCNG